MQRRLLKLARGKGCEEEPRRVEETGGNGKGTREEGREGKGEKGRGLRDGTAGAESG